MWNITYDIQKVAFSIIRNEIKDILTEKELNTIKSEAFKQGAILEDILFIFGILLRDFILDEKGISISSLDKK